MAVTVTCQGTIINECDATTGWSSGTLYSADPDPVEATYCLGVQVSTATVRVYLTQTAQNYSDKVLAMWYTHRASLDTLANGGVGIYVSDGTNTIVFHVAGKDRAVFRHDDGPSLWQCAVLDTSYPPEQYTVVSGSLQNLNWSAITRIGWQFKTLAKSVGGVENCFWDILRYYNPGYGLSITGGTSASPGTFDEVASADRQTGNQQAFGILRKLGAKLYGAQGALNFGAVNANTWFSESECALVFEDRRMAANKYKLSMVGGAPTYENHLVLRRSVIRSAQSAVTIDFSGSGIKEIDLTDSIVNTQGGNVACASDSYGADHIYDGVTFRSCGTVNLGRCRFLGARFVDSRAAVDGSAASWNVNVDPDGRLDDVVFVRGTNAHHAIEFGTQSPTVMTLRRWTVSGFNTLNGQNDSTLYIARTSGTVTINLVGCSGPMSYKSAGATVQLVVNPVTLAVTVKSLATGAPIAGARVYIAADSGGWLPVSASVSITRSGTTATVSHTDHKLQTNQKVCIHDSSVLGYEGVHTITVVNANTYTFSCSSSLPPNASAKSTAVLIEGVTGADGRITDTRSHISDQPFTGWVRMGSHSPAYEQFDVSGTVDSETGASVDVLMRVDE